jgi:hypothetical protein
VDLRCRDDDAIVPRPGRTEIGEYIAHYHHRPHSGLGHRTPLDVAATWRPDPDVLHTTAI